MPRHISTTGELKDPRDPGKYVYAMGALFVGNKAYLKIAGTGAEYPLGYITRPW